MRAHKTVNLDVLFTRQFPANIVGVACIWILLGELLQWLCQNAFNPPLSDLSEKLSANTPASQRTPAGGPAPVAPKMEETTETIIVQENKSLTLPDGSIKRIVRATYGFDNNYSGT